MWVAVCVRVRERSSSLSRRAFFFSKPRGRGLSLGGAPPPAPRRPTGPPPAPQHPHKCKLAILSPSLRHVKKNHTQHDRRARPDSAPEPRHARLRDRRALLLPAPPDGGDRPAYRLGLCRRISGDRTRPVPGGSEVRGRGKTTRRGGSGAERAKSKCGGDLSQHSSRRGSAGAHRAAPPPPCRGGAVCLRPGGQSGGCRRGSVTRARAREKDRGRNTRSKPTRGPLPLGASARALTSQPALHPSPSLPQARARPPRRPRVPHLPAVRARRRPA